MFIEHTEEVQDSKICLKFASGDLKKIFLITSVQFGNITKIVKPKRNHNYTPQFWEYLFMPQ